MLTIRRARASDADDIWRIFHAVVATGDTYAYDPETPREEALARWMAPGAHVYVAEEGDLVVGTYVLRANHRRMAEMGNGGDLWINVSYWPWSRTRGGNWMPRSRAWMQSR